MLNHPPRCDAGRAEAEERYREDDRRDGQHQHGAEEEEQAKGHETDRITAVSFAIAPAKKPLASKAAP